MNNFENIGMLFASFHYIFQIPYILYLTPRIGPNYREIFENKIDKFLLIFLFISGLVSSFKSIKWFEASVVSLIPFVFVWFYALGRWSIKNPKGVLYYMLEGQTILGFC